jgi:hypothetical protein
MDSRAHMEEANKYYVTVAVDRCIIPGPIVVLAVDRDAAARSAEMKIAVRIRDAITVMEISVREG